MKYLFLLFIIATSFKKHETISVKQFLWLEGNWKLKDKDVHEKWQLVNDTMMGGIGYHFIQEEHDEDETDIIFDESIRVVSRGEKFYYIPHVRNQNKGKEVEFEITSFTKNSFVAENPKHDFPQRIVYKLKDKKHIHAYIEGRQGGKKKRIEYHFFRTK